MAERVMVVDDEMPIRRIVARMLERAGYEVCVFAEADAAYQAFLIHPCSIVFTDRHLPDYNGVVLAKKIKEESPSTPVVMMSGQSPDDHEELSPFIDAFVDKPFVDPFALLELVRDLLNRNHA